VDIEKPQKDFIVLESISTGPEKMFYVINTEERQQILIGRGQDSDVRISDDISVSRCHAIINKCSKGGYYLEDYNSKFGTLVQVQTPVYLSPALYGS
jgi:pSer/pThr/pTyr-binding forkhead associated (FHA) protein